MQHQLKEKSQLTVNWLKIQGYQRLDWLHFVHDNEILNMSAV